MPRGRWLVCTLLVAATSSGRALAQPVEIAVGSGMSRGAGDGALDSRYSPLFPFVDHSGVASQQLVLTRDGAPVVWGSLTWFASTRVGIEARAGYRQAGLHGINGPYDVSLTYFARQPPDYVERQYSYDTSAEWPDTSGHVGQLTGTAAVVIRVGHPDRTTFRFVAGGGVTRVAGRVEPVAYTTFNLGGHSVLFPDEHRLSLRVAPATAMGVSTGADLHVPLGRRAGLLVGCRLFVPREMQLSVEVDGLADSDQGINEVDLDLAQRTLAPAPIRWRPVVWDVTAGLSLRF